MKSPDDKAAKQLSSNESFEFHYYKRTSGVARRGSKRAKRSMVKAHRLRMKEFTREATLEE